MKTTERHPEWVVVKIIRPTDLRTVKWNATYQHLAAKQYKLKPGQAVLFVNKKGDKCRVLIRLSTQLEGTLMMPVDPRGEIWGDCYNAANMVGDYIARRVSAKITKKGHAKHTLWKTLDEWLDDMADRSVRHQAWKKARSNK